jgi:hypothetical protein
MPEQIAETKQQALCCDGKLGEWCAAAEDCARREPLKCSVVAFGAGLLLAILPLGTIAGLLARLGFALVRPLLLVLGAMKVMEELEKRQQS